MVLADKTTTHIMHFELDYMLHFLALFGSWTMGAWISLVDGKECVG